MPLPRKRKCKHCHTFFRPDPRNANRQKYCSRPECRKASKAASQRKWLSKPENQNYFRNPDHVKRVQEWRKNHPGYWRKGPDKEKPLQDSLNEEQTKDQVDTRQLPANALQDIISSQHLVLLGLLANLTGNALQDDIAMTARKMRQLGQDILSNPNRRGGTYGTQQATDLSPPGSPGTGTVQLDRPPISP